MASGDTISKKTVRSNDAPATAFATLAKRNGHLVLLFDDTADESAIFSDSLPRAYAGGGLTVYLHYSMTSDITNKVRLDVSIERIGDGVQDIDSDGFAAAQSVNVAAVPGTSGNVDIVAVTFTDGAQMDSLAVGEGFRLKVTRVATDATNDTAVGDLEFHQYEIKET